MIPDNILSFFKLWYFEVFFSILLDLVAFFFCLLACTANSCVVDTFQTLLSSYFTWITVVGIFCASCTLTGYLCFNLQP